MQKLFENDEAYIWIHTKLDNYWGHFTGVYEYRLTEWYTYIYLNYAYPSGILSYKLIEETDDYCKYEVISCEDPSYCAYIDDFVYSEEIVYKSHGGDDLKPDLIIKGNLNLSVQNEINVSSVDENEAIILSFTISNIGDKESQQFDFRILIDGLEYYNSEWSDTNKSHFTVDNLNAGSSIEKSFSILGGNMVSFFKKNGINPYDSHKISIKVDSDNLVDEKNENNNISSEYTFEIKENIRPDLLFATEAELYNSNNKEQYKFYGNEDLYIKFYVGNYGKTPSGDFSFRVYIDGIEYYSESWSSEIKKLFYVSSLDQNEIKKIDFNIPIRNILEWVQKKTDDMDELYGEHNITIKLDTNNNVVEANESNNISEVTFEYKEITDYLLENIARNSWNGKKYTRNTIYSKKGDAQTDYEIGDIITVGEGKDTVFFIVDGIFSDPATGFYALGLLQCYDDEGKAVISGGNAILVCRGTQGDLLEQEAFSFSNGGVIDWLNNAVPAGVGYNQFNSAAGESATQWLNEQHNNQYYINITGQSLGAALAQMFASSTSFKVDNLVAFNPPAVNPKFGNAEISRIRYYITSGDIVSMAGEHYVDSTLDDADVQIKLILTDYSFDGNHPYGYMLNQHDRIFLTQDYNTVVQYVKKKKTKELVYDAYNVKSSDLNIENTSIISDPGFSFLSTLIDDDEIDLIDANVKKHFAFVNSKGNKLLFNKEYAKECLILSVGNTWLANIFSLRQKTENARKIAGEAIDFVNSNQSALLSFANAHPIFTVSITASALSVVGGYSFYKISEFLGSKYRLNYIGDQNTSAELFFKAMYSSDIDIGDKSLYSTSSEMNGHDVRTLDLNNDSIPDVLFDFSESKFLFLNEVKIGNFIPFPSASTLVNNCLKVTIGKSVGDWIMFSFPDFSFGAWRLSNVMNSQGESLQGNVITVKDRVYVIDDPDVEYTLEFTRNELVQIERGNITLIQEYIDNPSAQLDIIVSDIDASIINGGNNDLLTVNISIKSDPDRYIQFNLSESNLEGIFIGQIGLDTLANDYGLIVKCGDELVFSYNDKNTGDGSPELISKTLQTLGEDVFISITENGLPSDYSPEYPSPDWVNFSISVSSTSKIGNYVLASNATQPPRHILLHDNDNNIVYELDTNQQYAANGRSYSLSFVNGQYRLDIAELDESVAENFNKPEIASISRLDNGDFAVFLDVSSSVEYEYIINPNIEYSIDNGWVKNIANGNWEDYDDRVIVSSGQEICFREKNNSRIIHYDPNIVTNEYLPELASAVLGYDAYGSIISSGVALCGKHLSPSNIMKMTVSSGGYAYNTVISSGGTLSIQNAKVSSTTISSAGIQILQEGAIARETYVNNQRKDTSFVGGQFIYSGASALQTTLNNGGFQYILQGYSENTFIGKDAQQFVLESAVASHTEISANGLQVIYENGLAQETVIHSNGHVVVSSGGKIDSSIVSHGAILHINEGGILSGEHLLAGTLIVDGAVNAADAEIILDLTQLPANNSHYLIQNIAYLENPTYLVITDGTIGKYYLSSNAFDFTGMLTVKSDKSVIGSLSLNENFVNNDLFYTLSVDTSGQLILSIQNVPKSVNIYSSGILTSSAGVVKDIVIANGMNDQIDVSSGGMVFSSLISSGAAMFVSGGGYVSKAVIENQKEDNLFVGGLIISSGGTGKDISIHENGFTSVAAGGRIDSSTMSYGANLYICEGGIITGEHHLAGTLIAEGIVDASEAEFIMDLTQLPLDNTNFLIQNIGFLQGATYSVITDDTREYYYLANNASDFNETVSVYNDDCLLGTLSLEQSIISGDTIYSLFVDDYEQLVLSVQDAPACIYVYANNHLVSSANVVSGLVLAPGQNDSMHISSGGTAIDTDIISRGRQIVSMGGIADSTCVSSVKENNSYVGAMIVLDGGLARHAVIGHEGLAIISSGGTLKDSLIENQGLVSLNEQSVVDGELTVVGTLVVNGELDASHSSITIDITQRGEQGNSFYIENVTYLKDANITVIVDEPGHYILASKASSFKESITVQNAEGNLTGTIAVGNDCKINNYNYSLQIDRYSQLVLEVNKTVEINLSGDNVNPLNKSTLIASSQEGVKLCYNTVSSDYDGFWIEYKEPIQITSNATYYFAGIDKDNNIGYAEIEFSNIDVNAPTITGIKADITVPTNNNVVVYADFADDLALKFKLYRIGSGSWQTYTNGAVVTSNATVLFRAIDSAGNSTTSSYEVANIDKIKPTIENIGEDVTGPTNGNVVVTADFADDMALKSKEYRIGDGDWLTYTNGAIVSSNGMVGFRAIDSAGNSTISSYEVTNIDTIPQTTPVLQADITEATSQNVTITALFDDDVSYGEYRIDDGEWRLYEDGVVMTANGKVSFRAVDEAGNKSEIVDYIVSNIQKDDWQSLIVTSSLTISSGITATSAVVSSGGKLYVTTGGTVVDTTVNSGGRLEVSSGGTAENATVNSGGNMFISSGAIIQGSIELGGTMGAVGGMVQAGNANILLDISRRKTTDGVIITDISLFEGGTYSISVSASQAEGQYRLAGNAVAFAQNVTLTVKDTDLTTTLTKGVKATVGGKEYTLSVLGGNLCLTVAGTPIPAPTNLSSNNAKLSWSAVSGESGYVVEYSQDNFATVISVETATIGLEHYNVSSGTWQWRVRAKEGAEWAVGNNITISSDGATPIVVTAVEDDVKDAFFVTPLGTWDNSFRACHMGVNGVWEGTGETVVFGRENRFGDIFQGSTDENVLLLTDDANGDALFVYDIYTESPDDLAKFQSRLKNIKEIRAGAGNDIVDMTSDAFDYLGGGLSIHGGLGNDTIWSNAGDNTLFGDAGNDRIVGANGNDVIVGGSGNDSMHGGGGDDVFAFGGEWGHDNIEQLADGKVTLWFENGSLDKWNASTLTYTDGDKSVAVSGVAASAVTLKFGDDGSAQYRNLLEIGAFDEFSSERIFENRNNRGMLA